MVLQHPQNSLQLLLTARKTALGLNRNLSVSAILIIICLFTNTGQTLAAVVTDVLTRLALPIENLRAQTYDDAANMAVGSMDVKQ